jgi:hypothetical protein
MARAITRPALRGLGVKVRRVESTYQRIPKKKQLYPDYGTLNRRSSAWINCHCSIDSVPGTSRSHNRFLPVQQRLEKHVMKKISYVLAALATIAVAAPTVASAGAFGFRIGGDRD